MAGSKVSMDAFEKAMQRALDQAESSSSMRAAGEYAVDRIVKRTRLGKGVADRGADPESLKPLSQSYKDQRAGKVAFFKKNGKTIPYVPKKKPELSSFTSPGKSNLTATGQMLDSVKVTSASTGSAKIAPSGSRSGSNLSNKDVAGYVSKERPFLNLSKPELNGLKKFFQDFIRNALRKELT